MIYRLRYCNKDGVEARVDIQKGSATPVVEVEGTERPFALNYKMDKPDKSGFFMTSSADISIFETSSFNIDNLKTSSETEIKVEHYINNILDWSGFVIPDFFSKTIGSPATVEMVASDRLATLKGVTLTDLNQYTSMRDLAVACLAHTGLSLPLYTLADFGNDGQTNAFFKSLGLSSRLSDTKGRNISCYDILKSILVASNSKLVQQDGAWHIVNKWQHEQGAGNLFSNLTSSTPYSEQTINFSDVHVGGRRSIVPVAAITGVYHEFGGGRSYPDNFDFRDFGLIPDFNFPDWTKGGTFNVSRGNKEIIGYSFDGQMQFGVNTVDNYFFNSNVFNTSNYLQMDGVPVPYATGQIEVVLDLNATAQTVSQFLTNVTAVKIAVGAVKDGSPTIWLNNNGIFAEDNAVIHNLNFERGATYQAQTKGFNLKGVINNPEGYSIIMRIYGSRDGDEDNRRQIAIHFARIEFKNTQDAPKGIIYKRRQGTDFTKEHDIDTTIFGDYMQKGLDGYFYEYPFDDTSSLYRTAGTLTQPLWTAPNDPEQLPLLHHVTRQKSRMFSLAHNMISARINVSSFKPLNIFIDCNSERHVIVSATYDFLRSEVEVELEQIASITLNVRDFIYSYFGDGESGISSVGGVSGGGGGGTGGGLTPEQIEILSWWKKDPDDPDTIFTEMNAYSTKELSAYGAGGDGGGGGSDYERLDTWASYDSSRAEWVLSAFLGNDLNTRVIAIDGRVTDLENSAGGGGSGSVTSVGISVPTGLSVANSPITSSGVIAIGLQTGYSIPTTVKQGQWDAAVTDFGNLEIGGRNMMVGTSFLNGSGSITPYGNTLTVSDVAYLPNTKSLFHEWTGGTGSGLLNRGFSIGRNSMIDEVEYTFSFYGKGFGDINLHGGSGFSVTLINKVALAEDWYRYIYRIIPTGGSTIFFRPNDNVNINYTIYINAPKLEKGTIPTDWTPAPEDKLDKSVFEDLFEKVEVSTGVFAIKAKYNFYGVGEVSAYGIGSGGGSGSGGIIETVYGYSNLGQTFNNSILTDTFNAYTINQINTRLVAVESGSALTVNTTGTGNAITSISKAGSVITADKGLTFSLSNHLHSASDITSGTFAIARIPTGTTGTTVALGNHLHTGIYEPVFTKNTAFNKNFGTVAGTVAEGNHTHNYLPLSGGDIKRTFEGWPNAINSDASNYINQRIFGVSTNNNTLSFFGDGNHNARRFGIQSGHESPTFASFFGILELNPFGGVVKINGTTAATVNSNVASATKLQAPRTIWGQSFDGSGNVTGALSGATTGSFTGAVTVNTLNISSTAAEAQLEFSRPSPNYITAPLSGGMAFITNGDSLSAPNSMMILSSNGNVGIGKGFTNSTTSITAQLHVRGDILATGSTTTTKVIFSSAGWSMEQVGSELQMKHNNIVKMRFTSTGAIVATNEITAFA